MADGIGGLPEGFQLMHPTPWRTAQTSAYAPHVLLLLTTHPDTVLFISGISVLYLAISPSIRDGLLVMFSAFKLPERPARRKPIAHAKTHSTEKEAYNEEGRETHVEDAEREVNPFSEPQSWTLAAFAMLAVGRPHWELGKAGQATMMTRRSFMRVCLNYSRKIQASRRVRRLQYQFHTQSPHPNLESTRETTSSRLEGKPNATLKDRPQ
jgi:hypothetical protein